MSAYARQRTSLLAAARWNAWAARRGYSSTAATTRKSNQRALAGLRANRKAAV